MKKLNSYQRKALETYVKLRLPALRAEFDKSSTGVTGKFMEALRVILNERPTDVLRCRAANRTDLRLGRNRLYEVKTGSGAVAYGEDTELGFFTKDDMTEDNVFHGVTEVIWMPFHIVPTQEIVNLPDAEAVQAMLELFLQNSWTFTRQEFIDLLTCMGRKGLQSSLHITKSGRQLNIQTISPKMESKFWDYVDGRPTAYEVLL